MKEHIEDLARRLVIGSKRDGRCVYDEKVKAELVAECAKPGVSKSKLARQVGVNAIQLRRWIREQESGGRRAAAVKSCPVPAAFVPVHIDASSATHAQASVSMDMQARLPNGVVLDLRGCDMQQAGDLIQALRSLRCSASTKG